ncbi:MAG: alkaline phosphatase [Opitutales bacterium]|nr:alkaline phosphatase [Opitutales bacterium]
MNNRKRNTILLAALLAAGTPLEAAKNVILMISDGAGYNVWTAASMYQGRVSESNSLQGTQVYDGSGWVRYGCSTYSASSSSKPDGKIDESVVYDPTKVWDASSQTAVNGQGDFAGYNWVKTTCTDSAAAATALSTGQKVYNNSMNWSSFPAPTGTPLDGRTIAEIAKAEGKAVGSISSVQFSHATPAGLGGAHNISRNNYEAIANEMLSCDWLDVIMGAGHPDYDDNGALKESPNYRYVGGEATWTALENGTHEGGWTLVDEKADFEALANPSRFTVLPTKIVGVPQVASTLQQSRSGGNAEHEPFAETVPLNSNVPDLATMSLAALNVLNQDEDGFFLHIEGGAVDWAGHANQKGRIIEEQIDFNNAVEAVIAWVEENSSWDDTLLILTADHDCGMLMGPDAATVAYDELVYNGAGVVPGMAFMSGNHTNQLVPVYAKGAEASLFANYIDGIDPVRGQYVDNTDIFRVMKEAVSPTPEVTGDEDALNVIIMISDGCGYNTWNAASYYQYGALGEQPYEQDGWLEMACSTFMATAYHEGNNSVPSGYILERNIYNPLKAWDSTDAGFIYNNDTTGAFVGYNWLKQTPTDSASAATALSSGYKTYNGAINWANWPAGTGTKLEGQTLAEYAHQWGRKVGTISSVQWSHATPAGLGGSHNFSRNNYAEIANEMLEGGWLDVIMGAGNPDYDDNGALKATAGNAKYVGGSDTWAALKAGTHTKGWTLIQSKEEFEAVAAGTLLPKKLVGTAQAATTLQQSRSGGNVKHDAFDSAYPLNSNVPDLATMSVGALNVLANDNERGFFLHIEGGAVDWSGHANQPGRIIEEQVDFNNAVEAVINWVEENSSWEKTLLIVTTDHDTGLIMGPNGDTVAYDPIVNNGQGEMPSMTFNSNSHSNQLVPVYVKGSGANILPNLVDGEDPVRGAYVDNTDLFTLAYNVMRPKYEENVLSEGATRYSDGWKHSDWFGVFWDGFYPWVYAPSFSDGWVWIWEGSTSDNMWLCTESDGWLWTAEGWYPWVWSNDLGEWITVY